MPRLEVHVALVLFWCLLAGVREAEVWVRGVLRGMIAADLVIGAAVSRSQINVLELTVLKTKGNSNKAARHWRRPGARRPANSTSIATSWNMVSFTIAYASPLATWLSSVIFTARLPR